MDIDKITIVISDYGTDAGAHRYIAQVQEHLAAMGHGRTQKDACLNALDSLHVLQSYGGDRI